MSRGDRVPTTGNLSNSMRENYGELGVEEYYRRVGATYRNPHFPGVRLCIFSWLNKWWRMEGYGSKGKDILFFDMAAGSGEATLVVAEWWATAEAAHKRSLSLEESPSNHNVLKQKKKHVVLMVPAIEPSSCYPKVMAADPFTAEAYQSRTSHSCSSLSFRDISEGELPTNISKLLPIPLGGDSNLVEHPESSAMVAASSDGCIETATFTDPVIIDMTICSFALHLVPSASELFSLLWRLSTRSKWLIVLAPHKKPEIKAGWGWIKWNAETWVESPIGAHSGELLEDRVHCRVYRSVNFWVV